jgi:hypothetical protein
MLGGLNMTVRGNTRYGNREICHIPNASLVKAMCDREELV